MRSKLEKQLEAPERARALGEPLVCAIRASTPTHGPTPMRLLGGIGAAAERAIDRAELARRNPLPFTLTSELALALTATRVAFWSYDGLLVARPRALLGTVERAAIEKLELSRRRAVLSLWFPAHTLELAVRDLDDAARFVAAARDAGGPALTT
jgi:hypothetical protein